MMMEKIKAVERKKKCDCTCHIKGQENKYISCHVVMKNNDVYEYVLNENEFYTPCLEEFHPGFEFYHKT
jgi:hypothetical protein